MANKKVKLKKSSRANYLAIVVVLVLFVSVVYAVFSMGNLSFDPRSFAGSQLAVSLHAGNGIVNSTKTITVMIDAKNKHVAFANIALEFDPTSIQIVSDVSASSVLHTVLLQTSLQEANQYGKFSFTVSTPLGSMDTVTTGVYELGRFSIARKNPNTSGTTAIGIDATSTQLVDIAAAPVSVTTNNLTLSLPEIQPSTNNVTPSTPRVREYRVRLMNVPDPSSNADLFLLNYLQIAERTYQESDAFFTYSGRWIRTDTAMYTTNTTTVSFETKEPVVTLATSKGPNRGTVQVYVDDVLKQTIKLTQPTVVDPYLVQLNLR